MLKSYGRLEVQKALTKNEGNTETRLFFRGVWASVDSLEGWKSIVQQLKQAHTHSHDSKSFRLHPATHIAFSFWTLVGNPMQPSGTMRFWRLVQVLLLLAVIVVPWLSLSSKGIKSWAIRTWAIQQWTCLLKLRAHGSRRVH